MTLTFSGEVASALSIGKHAPEQEDLVRQFERTRDGALAFIAWAELLLVAYFKSSGTEFGKPEFLDKR